MVNPSDFKLGSKKNSYFKAEDILKDRSYVLPEEDKKALTGADIIYRALCAMLYNYAPLSGHPGGSISSGRIAASLAYKVMDYDFKDPDLQEADILSYAAGHKALGLYAMSALRNEIAKVFRPALLAPETRQLRLEDLLGFRKSPAAGTKLVKQFSSKALDGHPVPLVPFVRLSTGASGIGLGSSIGLGLAAACSYKENTPKVNIIEGEGGLTAGRSAEALAIAAAAGLDNVILHLDWNQASIDSDKVTADKESRGDYTAWTPAELCYINGFNVIEVADGFDFEQVYAAQKFAYDLNNGCPTAIIYRTVKGWHYGIEGKASHGSGHKFASEGFYKAMEEFENAFGVKIPRFEGEQTPDNIERSFWDCLLCVRRAVAEHKEVFEPLAEMLVSARGRLSALKREISAPEVQKVYTSFTPEKTPEGFSFPAGEAHALRTVMGSALAYISQETGGSILVSTADLSGSTGAGAVAKPFAKGFYNKYSNPESKYIASGGICEDGMSSVMSGVSAYGTHIGLAASYAAFTSAMMHTQARLHAIGQQCWKEATGKPERTFIIFTGHAGMQTGEDGPTHADPQALQLIMEDFPKGAAITLTPLDGNDVWPVLSAALVKRPAVLYPVVSRPNVKVIDRAALGADAPEAAAKGVYRLCKSSKENPDGVIVVQGPGAGEVFCAEVLPELKKRGVEINAYYVTSRELFTALPEEEREALFPYADMQKAIALTDFTLPTMYCWLKSKMGAEYSIYPFMQGKYMSSGKAKDVYKEAHMDAKGQLEKIEAYLETIKAGKWQ